MRLITALSLLALLSSPATPAELPNEAPEGKRWMSCFIRLKDANARYSPRMIAVGGYWLIDVPDNARSETEKRLRDVWVEEYASRIPSEFPGKIADPQNGSGYDARCTSYESRGEWASFVAHVKEPVTSTSVLRSDYVPTFAQAWVSTREHARGYQGEVGTSGSVKTARSSGKAETGAAKSAESGHRAERAKEQPPESAQHAAEARRRQSEEVAARNRAKQAKYEADMKAWQDQLDAQKAAEEQKQAKFEADKQAAAQRLAAFASEQEAHRQEMEKAAEELRNYQDAQRHHALCTAGDRSACEALVQGKPVSVPKDAIEASTDDDARQCVTEPVLSPSEVWKGALKAVVVNGCAKPVDVRICLMRTGGWNCGMTLGLKPQEDWTWWTSNPQDGVFWDARTSGTNRKLGSPQG